MSEIYDIRATYSPEDNSLRLYPDDRLEDEVYQRVKSAGFTWAPKQGLFVAKRWTPQREDLCMELAGTIEPEDTTVLERAQAKADRLDALALKRAHQAEGYLAAAERISERFAAGQPILLGHHSQRRAERDKEKMLSATEKAGACLDAVDYWNYRAEGVERHANRKNDPRVRTRRIKTLLKELRDHQGVINHGYRCLSLWEAIRDTEDQARYQNLVRHYCGAMLKTGMAAPDHLYRALEQSEIEEPEVVRQSLEYANRLIRSEYHARWIHHILNRLAYERSELGETPRFEGELTPVILQAFAREQGALDPKAERVKGGLCLRSSVPLPLHLNDGQVLTLSCDAWRDLMQELGHSVNTKERKSPKRQAVSLINPTPEQAEMLQTLWNADAMKRSYIKPVTVLYMLQEEYSRNSGGDYAAYQTITLDERGRRIYSAMNGQTPSCRIRVAGSGQLYGANRVIVIQEKPKKPLPFELKPLLLEVEAAEGAA